MAGESRLEEDITACESDKAGSARQALAVVPFYKLFSFSDSLDRLLMFIGTIAAAGTGVCMPLMTIITGDVIDAFGGNVNTKQIVHQVSKVSLKFVYLAVGSFFASSLRKNIKFSSENAYNITEIIIWLNLTKEYPSCCLPEVTCWMVTGERQAARIRSLYLKAILRQDIGFFDKETNSGDVVGRMSGDTVLIQEAMGEKVGRFIQLVATFSGGFIVAFIKGWLMTLVLLSCIPPLVFSGATIGFIIGKMTARGQAAYSDAAIVVEQTISSIRTVASFTGEKQAIAKYNHSLIKAYRAGVQGGLAAGLGLGVVRVFVYSSYALAIWFGGKMVLEKGYTGGQVITVFFAVLTGSLSLGQTTPSLSAFAAGQAAAFKMLETINRKPDIDACDSAGRQPEDIRGDIELKEVSFSYPMLPW